MSFIYSCFFLVGREDVYPWEDAMEKVFNDMLVEEGLVSEKVSGRQTLEAYYLSQL